jgi:hypothetical protein
MSNEQEIKKHVSEDGAKKNPESKIDVTAALQKHADYYISMLMNEEVSKHDLQPEIANIQLAILRLKNGEISSEYIPEQLEERLQNINFARMGLRNPSRNK